MIPLQQQKGHRSICDSHKRTHASKATPPYILLRIWFSSYLENTVCVHLLLSWQNHQYLVWQHRLQLFWLYLPYLNSSYSVKHKYQFRLDFDEHHRLPYWRGPFYKRASCQSVIIFGKEIVVTSQLPNKYDFLQRHSLPLATPLCSVISWCFYKNNENIENSSPFFKPTILYDSSAVAKRSQVYM